MPLVLPEVGLGPFTVDDYHRMVEVGLLDSHARVELLDGLVVMMSPIGRRHQACVTRLNGLFATLAAAERVSVSPQNSVQVDERTQPQPDMAILPYRRDGYLERLPGPDDILLCIEVMDSSVGYDRRVKVPLYARAGIREVWLVDLQEDAVDVLREPGEEGYTSVRRVKRGERLVPHLMPDVALAADDILG